MIKTLTIGILFSIAFASCQKLENSIESGNTDMKGTWVNPQYTDTIVTYTRVEKLVENEIGITFNSNNTLVYRQNSGWCGTPPISTADYEGTWNWNDSVVNINVGYWGGTADFTWKIISLNGRKLEISVVKSEYHQEKKAIL